MPTPTAHAATSPSSSIIEALRKAGYVQLKPHSYAQSPAAYKTAPHSVNNATIGAYQFSDNLFSVGNGFYVSPELGYTGGNYGMLRARSAYVNSSDAYKWYADSDGGYVIQSAANGLYVSAELGYTGGNYGMLRARTDPNSIGPWEQFNVYTQNACDPVHRNCQAVIYSIATDLLVSAELGYAGSNYAMLRARSSISGPWEQFDI